MRQWFRIAFPRNYLDRRKRAGFLFVLPALLFFGFVFILPLAQSVMYSFYKIAPGGAKEFVGLRLYEKVLTDSTFWTAVGNTVQLLLFSVPATVVLALAVALGLNRIISLKWRNVWAAMTRRSVLGPSPRWVPAIRQGAEWRIHSMPIQPAKRRP